MFYMFFKIVLLLIVFTAGALLIYDQIAITFANELPETIKPLGILELLGIEKAFANLGNNTERLGYYLVFFGSSAMFIFLSLAWVLKMIPILGKIMLWFLGIIPVVSIIIIIVGALMLTGVIPVIPGV